MSMVARTLTFPIAALLQLLWSYVVWCALLAGLFAAGMAVLGALGERVDVWFDSIVVIRIVALATVVILATFRTYFHPRFPDVPIVLAFVMTSIFAVPILASTLIFFVHFEAMHELSALPAWIVANTNAFLMLVGWSAAIATLCGLFGMFDLWAGSAGRVLLSRHRILGHILVGRAAFDAFVEREAARLGGEYESYVDDLRK